MEHVIGVPHVFKAHEPSGHRFNPKGHYVCWAHLVRVVLHVPSSHRIGADSGHMICVGQLSRLALVEPSAHRIG